LRDLTDLLTNDESDATLDRAALDIARIEYPDLDPDPWLRILDDIAMEVAARAGDLADNRRFVETANSHLFRTLGLRGNAADYYNVRNSCLNDVLDRRLGIPITLSLVYIEVARRLAKPVFGIGLPSHFIVQFNDGDLNVFIDPFDSGRFLSKADCIGLVLERVGGIPDDHFFRPVTPRQIAGRMLQNMKAVYVRTQEFEKALQVFDFILSSGAYAAHEYKQRAAVNLQLQRYRAAQSDLEMYATMAPDAEDRSDVLSQIEAIDRYLANLS
jgi:regulator of sirC expression with transglutaminase-like and TPR domain